MCREGASNHKSGSVLIITVHRPSWKKSCRQVRLSSETKRYTRYTRRIPGDTYRFIPTTIRQFQSAAMSFHIVSEIDCRWRCKLQVVDGFSISYHNSCDHGAVRRIDFKVVQRTSRGLSILAAIFGICFGTATIDRQIRIRLRSKFRRYKRCQTQRNFRESQFQLLYPEKHASPNQSLLHGTLLSIQHTGMLIGRALLRKRIIDDDRMNTEHWIISSRRALVVSWV